MWRLQEIFLIVDSGKCGKMRKGYIQDSLKSIIVDDGAELPLERFATEQNDSKGLQQANANEDVAMKWRYGVHWAFIHDENTCKKLFKMRFDYVDRYIFTERQTTLSSRKLLKYLRQEYPVKEAIDKTMSMMRKQYIGEDRYYNRYWYFVRGASDPYRSSYIFVELSTFGAKRYHSAWYAASNIIGKSSINDLNSGMMMQIEDDEKDTSYLAGSWFCVAGETQLKRLMLSLNPEGRRESKLLISLAKQYELFNDHANGINISRLIFCKSR